MSIKIERARRLATIGNYPQTWIAILAAMPEILLENGTSRMIANVADAMRKAHQVGYSLGLRDGNPGGKKSEVKAIAARENGRNGGRPKKSVSEV